MNFVIYRDPHHILEEFGYEGFHCICHIMRQKVERSLGTLGGGEAVCVIKKEHGDIEVISETRGYEKGCFISNRFRAVYDLSDLAGTILWIYRSPFRKNHKRKNWNVGVSIFLEQNEVASDKEYRIEKLHCGGKGSQNVNKVETGVRIINLLTGIV